MIDRIRRYSVAWEAIYSALRERRVGYRRSSLMRAFWRSTNNAWMHTKNGGVLRRVRDDDVIGRRVPK